MPHGGNPDFEEFRFLWSRAARRADLLAELLSSSLSKLDSKAAGEVRNVVDEFVAKMHGDPISTALDNSTALEIREMIMRALPSP